MLIFDSISINNISNSVTFFDIAESDGIINQFNIYLLANYC